MRFKLFLISLVISITAAAAGGPTKVRFEVQDDDNLVIPFADPIDGIEYRLPNNTLPLHYDIYLSTDIHIPFFSFDGIVTIKILALNDTPDITIHFRQLVILSIELLASDGTLIQSNVNYLQDEVREFLIIRPQNSLIKDQTYHVKIAYLGTLRNDDAGFYLGSYVDSNGVRKYHATTQFESTDARHAFPCYDEPQIRTSFAVTFRHHATYRAITNTPVISSLPDITPGYMITKFAEIPSMQTYLLAFLISDFNFVSNTSVVPPQRVFAKPSSISNGDANYALGVSPDVLKGFEDYLNISYTFAKMDQVALPNFAAGAMENWGLVTYREIYLLYNPLTSTTRNKENVLLTISHEFVHQWFGNLVCPQWWSYLWLNEGFATLYEYYLTHYVYPDERWDDSFIVDVLQSVMETDSNPTRRPMTYYVENPVQIDRLFDSVAYSKSGSVLHTFMHAFGAETWRKGLNYYLNNRYDKYANSDHLYEGLQTAVNEDTPSASTPVNVGMVMRSWETQGGFPLISVSRNASHVTISQERFLYNNEGSQNIWHVPINYYTASTPDSSKTTPDMWINARTRSFSLNVGELDKIKQVDDWIILNTQQTYYYRVNYDETLWQLIVNQINSDSFQQIHLRNRAQLIADAFHLARAGKIDYGILFGLMNYLSRETDYMPWLATNRAATSINRWLSGSRIYADYQAFVRKNVEPLFKRLGTQLIANEARVDRYARTIAINLACQAQLPECLHETNQELLAFVYNDKRIAPEYVTTIQCNGMRKANSVLFNYMTDLMLKSGSQTERNNIITAIGCMQNEALLHDFLTLAIIPSIALSLDERNRIFTAAAPNGDYALHTILDFTEENLNYIHALNGTAFNSILSSVASRIGSQELYDRFVEVMTIILNYEGITQNNFDSHELNARQNLNWQAGNIEPIERFLAGYSTTTVPPTQGAGSVIASIYMLVTCSFVKYIL